MFTAENFYCPSNAELREIAPCISIDIQNILLNTSILKFFVMSEAFSYENTAVEQKRNICNSNDKVLPFQIFSIIIVSRHSRQSAQSLWNLTKSNIRAYFDKKM